MNQEFIYVTYIKTTPEKLWQALTEGEFTRLYWFGYHLESDWKVGSAIKFYDATGELVHNDKVIRADKPKFLSYTWKSMKKGHPDEPPSTVNFELEKQGPLVKLTVTHFDFPANSKVFPMISGGWPAVLSSLKSFLETDKPFAPEANTACGKNE